VTSSRIVLKATRSLPGGHELQEFPNAAASSEVILELQKSSVKWAFL
jgi:hypothetical protein